MTEKDLLLIGGLVVLMVFLVIFTVAALWVAFGWKG